MSLTSNVNPFSFSLSDIITDNFIEVNITYSTLNSNPKQWENYSIEKVNFPLPIFAKNKTSIFFPPSQSIFIDLFR